MDISPAFLKELAARVTEREEQLAAAASENPRKFRDLLKSHARLKKILAQANILSGLEKTIREHRELVAAGSSDPELKALAQAELTEAEKALPEAERRLLIELAPPNPNDERNAIVEIRAGTGGSEAALFAGDLARMYMRYAEKKGWPTEIMDASSSEVGGYKEIVFSIQGQNVFRALQFEGGTHRVQRIPVTEAAGRIHTSTATVAVLPEAEDMDEIEIKPEDLRVDVYRASGAGGQHVNKTDSAVRLTHLPTGLVAASQAERSQHKNRAKALRILRSHLLAAQRQVAQDRVDSSRRAQIGSGDRSERIRTYNFPQNRLTDHRIHFTLYALDKIMEGELETLLLALYEHNHATQTTLSLDQLLKI
ncbi:MAG: peptide chain release factor 1 [Lentisphaerae bacterium]|nr:peptide chain release factor 1 [Lentisphaerota bacterium]